MYVCNLLPLKDSEPHPSGGAARQVSYTLHKLGNEFRKKITIKNIAQELGVSPSYLSRIFKEEVGITPHDFLLSKRIERARRLLSDTNLDIYLIAIESGFSSQSHLTRYFSKQVGLPPSKYRKHVLKGRQAIDWVKD